MAKVPAKLVNNVRNEMYLVSDSLSLMDESGKPRMSARDKGALAAYDTELDSVTKYIPDWGKGRGLDCAGSWHHDRLETHCRNRRRTYR